MLTQNKRRIIPRPNWTFNVSLTLAVYKFTRKKVTAAAMKSLPRLHIADFIFIFPGTIEPILVSWKTVSLEFVLGCVCSAAIYIAALGRASIKPKLRLSLYHVFFVFKDNLHTLFGFSATGIKHHENIPI